MEKQVKREKKMGKKSCLLIILSLKISFMYIASWYESTTKNKSRTKKKRKDYIAKIKRGNDENEKDEYV